jgi:hypothetical protein
VLFPSTLVLVLQGIASPLARIYGAGAKQAYRSISKTKKFPVK